MASNGCSPITFVDTCQNSFYFKVEVAETEVDRDTLAISSEVRRHLSHCKDHKFLILNAGKFEAKELYAEELFQPESEFNIQIYKETSVEPRLGKPVMLYVKKNGQKMVACCRGDCEIHAEAMDPPQTIDGTAHKALFYLTEHEASDKYMFESTMHQSRFLGFERENNNPSLLRLVLRQKTDEVDESFQITMSECKKQEEKTAKTTNHV